MLGYQDTRIPGYQDTRILGYQIRLQSSTPVKWFKRVMSIRSFNLSTYYRFYTIVTVLVNITKHPELYLEIVGISYPAEVNS